MQNVVHKGKIQSEKGEFKLNTLYMLQINIILDKLRVKFHLYTEKYSLSKQEISCDFANLYIIVTYYLDNSYSSEIEYLGV